MQLKQRYFQFIFLLILATILAVNNSKYPYFCLFISSILLIGFTLKNLYEDNNIILDMIQIILSALLCFVSGYYLVFIIFYEVLPNNYNNKLIKIAFPNVVFLIFSIIMKKSTLATMLFQLIILVMISIMIYYVEKIFMKYILTSQRITDVISMTAVSEMYQKKLNEELLVKNYLIDRNARLEERENISRNIHNSVGHTIVAAIMTLDAADILFDVEPDRAREKMYIAKDRIHSSLESVRQAVRVLDDENELVNLNVYLEQTNGIFDDFENTVQVRIRCRIDKAFDIKYIPNYHVTFLKGAIQEILTNGVKHGQADLFTVIQRITGSHLQISITDNGKSDFSEKNREERIENGFGLKKIQSYVINCGGQLEIENKNGFKIVITLPLMKESCNG